MPLGVCIHGFGLFTGFRRGGVGIVTLGLRGVALRAGFKGYLGFGLGRLRTRSGTLKPYRLDRIVGFLQGSGVLLRLHPLLARARRYKVYVDDGNSLDTKDIFYLAEADFRKPEAFMSDGRPSIFV